MLKELDLLMNSNRLLHENLSSLYGFEIFEKIYFFWNSWLYKLKIDYEFAWLAQKSSVCVAFVRIFFQKKNLFIKESYNKKINLFLRIFQDTLWSALSMLEY